MPNAASTQQREIHYRGDVQGVGFRATTLQIASSLAVTGYVLNLPDGRVKLVAEDSPAGLDHFEHQIEQQLDQYIEETTHDIRPATGAYAKFEVRY